MLALCNRNLSIANKRFLSTNNYNNLNETQSNIKLVRQDCTIAQKDLNLFQELNKHISEGRWNQINHKPKVFMWPSELKKIWPVWEKIVGSETPVLKKKPFYYGYVLIFRLIFYVTISLGVIHLYNQYVPEEYRYKYKYRKISDHH